LLVVTYALFGIGFGMINPPITNTAVSGMPPSQAGVAAAVASTSRQVGMTLGVAVLGALAGGASAGAIGRSFAAATHVSWWIILGLSVLILVLGVVTTTPWAHRTAVATADRLRETEPEPAADRPAPEQPAELVRS
jgi:MFS family permease